MNIWIINHNAIPPSLGGLNRHYYFSKYLNLAGHQVKIFTASQIHNTDINMILNKTLFLEKEIEKVHYTYVRTGSYAGNGLDRMWNMVQFPINMWKATSSFSNPDIIYTSSPSPFTAFASVLLAKKLKVPCVVEIRDLWPESIVEYKGMSRKNPIIRALYHMEKWIYKHADRIIFTMEGGKDYICEKGWDRAVDLDKIYHVNNGVDLEEFDRNKTKYALDDEDLNNPDTFKVVYAGSIRTANNVGGLLDSAAILKKQNSSIRFLIYGDGTERKNLEKRIVTEGLDNVLFKGKVKKKYIPYIVSQSNLNILHYSNHNIWKYGGSQNKLFEYLASGKPVLSDVTMGYCLLNRYNAGISLKEQTPETIANAIHKISCLSTKDYNHYCINARLAAEKYDYNNLACKIESILEGAIRQ